MSNQSEFDPVAFAVWLGIFILSIAFWAGVFLLVDWIV